MSYLRSLAEHVVGARSSSTASSELDDEQVIAELVAVKGIGEWSAHMFLMFAARRAPTCSPPATSESAAPIHARLRARGDADAARGLRARRSAGGRTGRPRAATCGASIDGGA